MSEKEILRIRKREYDSAIKWDLAHKIITAVQKAAGKLVSENKNPYRK